MPKYAVAIALALAYCSILLYANLVAVLIQDKYKIKKKKY